MLFLKNNLYSTYHWQNIVVFFLCLEFNKESVIPPRRHKRSRNPKVSCCPHCDYSTTRRDHFKRHVLRHPEQELFTVGSSGREGKKTRTCCECGYTTMRKDHFKRHMMRHTGEKPYTCMTCGYATTHSIHLKRHILRQGHKPNPQIESEHIIYPVLSWCDLWCMVYGLGVINE